MTREEAMEIIDKMPLCNECDSSNFPYTCVECGDAFMLAMEALKQPEIVRCKDCKFFTTNKFDAEGYGNCKKDVVWRNTTTDWFCADGVK